ncbi:sensor histidine kinase [Chitinophaga deserti]|uniref:sensor histidine kinase n=1 Tax=Chitinophaga deserti TaxID=2164099 RepID=UPI000D6B6EC5|nr:histidine kinase [Chitinophaga deserti]
MSKSFMGKIAAAFKKRAFSNITWGELTGYCLLFMLQDFVLYMPELVVGRINASYLQMIWWDAVILLIVSVPAWYLVFRKYKDRPLRFRFRLHLFIIPLFWLTWFGGTQIFHYLSNRPFMAPLEMLRSVFPVIVYYLQCFSLLHVYNFFLEREAQLKKEKELADAAHRSEINALKAQIQPHFLFNTLNSISASVPIEQEPTRELIARLADTFRYSLYCTEHEWVPLKEEIRYIRTMLELEHSRFRERLEFNISPLNGSENIMIPAMLLQPVVENAIRHGIAPSIHGGKINIDIAQEADKLRIEVSDTGVGYSGELTDLERSPGVGLRNIRQRLELLFSETMHIYRNQPSGLRFKFYTHTNLYNSHEPKVSPDHR